MIPTRRLHGPVNTRSSYYQADNTQGPSLIRARKPFLVKNILTGGAIVALTASIYFYTIKAVAQDNFEDVKVPDAPNQPPKTPDVGTSTTKSSPLAK